MTIKQNTDMERLHEVFEMDNPGRGVGKTFLQCHNLAGVMETTDQSGVYCRVDSLDDVRHIMQMLVFKVFPDHGINYIQSLRGYDFAFKMPNGDRKRLNFILLEKAEWRLLGNAWPIVTFNRQGGVYERGINEGP